MKYLILSVIVLGALVGFTFPGKESFIREKDTLSETRESSSTPLLFVGDVMLGRHVETLARESGDDLRSFRNMAAFLRDHVAIANLEGPIPESHVQTPNNGFSFSFVSSTPRVLKEGGIAAVSLANNHMFDKGKSGWEHTKLALDEEGIFHFGGYAPTEGDFFETKLGTTTVVVYGITMIATGWDEEQALEVTKKTIQEHAGAYVIAFLHWGDEYVPQNAYQREFSYKLIDNGVDAIIGAHPHVVQGVELYKGKPIFYSLGNFIFDQYWRADLEDGLMVRLSEAGPSFAYELIPVRSVRSVPHLATSTVHDRILSNLASISSPDLRPYLLKGVFHVPK